MTKPFNEEEYVSYEIEYYNLEDVADNGKDAKYHKYSLDTYCPAGIIAGDAKTMGFDSFCVTKIIENKKDYDVNDFELQGDEENRRYILY